MKIKKKILILGSTGSIGKTTFNIIKENKKLSDLLQAENKEEFISKMIHYEKNRKIES